MKILGQTQLAEVFILAHSNKEHPIVTGKSWEQELKGASHIVSAVKEQ